LPARAVGLMGAALLVAGNAYRAPWPVHFAGALLLALWLYRIAAPWLKDRAPLTYLGIISMPLFLVNGFVRGPFVEIARQHTWGYQLALGFCSMGLSILVAQLLRTCEEMLRSASNVSLQRNA